METGIPLIPQPETYQVINNNFECIGNNTNSHFNLTKAQINEKIGELVSVKREQINKSNEMEFVNIQNGGMYILNMGFSYIFFIRVCKNRDFRN